MTLQDTTSVVAARSETAPGVPEQIKRGTPLSPTDRIARQVAAIDAWVAGRRQREQALHMAAVTRDDRLIVAREVDVLQRTHDAIKDRCARGLEAAIEPMPRERPTAVIAHRHAWFAERLSLLFGGHGLTVLECTDNGAEALGVIVAEQPDLALVGDRLAMMPGRAVLAEMRRYAPLTLRAVQASDAQQAEMFLADADSIFLRHHPPGVVADALLALHLTAKGEAEARAAQGA